MKRLTLCAALCVTLAACGSDDKKPVAAAPKPVLKAVEGQKEGVVCPTINGRFNVENGEEDSEIKFTTKVEQGRFSYRIADLMPFLKADGQPVRYEGKDASESGAMLATCDVDSVTLIVQIDNEPNPVKMRYTPVGNNLRVEVKQSGNESTVTYVRQ